MGEEEERIKKDKKRKEEERMADQKKREDEERRRMEEIEQRKREEEMSKSGPRYDMPPEEEETYDNMEEEEELYDNMENTNTYDNVQDIVAKREEPRGNIDNPVEEDIYDNMEPELQDNSKKGAGISAIALYDYQAMAEDEISFDPNDLISNIEMVDEGWWIGECHGRFGLFPANYVQVQDQ